MLKLIESSSQDFGEPTIKIIDNWSGKDLVKSATDSQISEYIQGIKPEPNRLYLHVLAMGAGEFFGANRNADFFPEENLRKYHKTFEETGYIFRHHQNKDITKAIGKVLFSTYNNRMHRVELVLWVDRSKAADIVDRVESGEYPPTSMACRTPYDECSICGNQARTRQEYCSHLTTELGRVYADGRKVMAMNVAPLKFIDNSFVSVGADPTASVMQKVASHGNHHLVGSAELAEIEGLTEKAASHKKLSELVKEVDGIVVGYDSILDRVSDPEEETIPALAQHELVDVFNTLAHLGMTPSLRFLAELIAHKVAGPDAQGIGTLVEGYVGAHGVQELLVGEKSYDESKGPNRRIVDILSPSVKQASLNSEAVIQRSMLSSKGAFYVPGTNVGYVGSGPEVEETPTERFNRLVAAPQPKNGLGILGMLKSLIVIGGAALAAKWYITNTIEKKMHEAQLAMNNDAKIRLIKVADDYRSTYRLAKSSMVKTVKGL